MAITLPGGSGFPSSFDDSGQALRKLAAQFPITANNIADGVVPGLGPAAYEINVKDAPYSATGDGATDDTSALQGALTAAGVASWLTGVANQVIIPAGDYLITNTLTVPQKVAVTGAGRSVTRILADSSFPTSTYMVRLGAGGTLVFGCRVENLTIDCNNVTGSTGVYSTEANEQSGLQRVRIQNYLDHAIHLSNVSASEFCAHWLMDDVETGCGASASSTVAVLIACGTSGRGGQIRRTTIGKHGSASTQSKGIHVTGANGDINIMGLNVEGHTDGVYFDTDTNGTVLAASLHVAGTNLINIQTNDSIFLAGLFRSVGTNTIVNGISGQNVTASHVSLYTQKQSDADGNQQFYIDGQAGAHGFVTGASDPKFSVKSTATSTSAARSGYELRDGNNDGWKLHFISDVANDPLQFRPIAAGVLGGSALTLDDRPGIGFLGAASVTRPSVTGSRGGNAALASLLTALASLGLITDSSSA